MNQQLRNISEENQTYESVGEMPKCSWRHFLSKNNFTYICNSLHLLDLTRKFILKHLSLYKQGLTDILSTRSLIA